MLGSLARFSLLGVDRSRLKPFTECNVDCILFSSHARLQRNRVRVDSAHFFVYGIGLRALRSIPHIVRGELISHSSILCVCGIDLRANRMCEIDSNPRNQKVGSMHRFHSEQLSSCIQRRNLNVKRVRKCLKLTTCLFYAFVCLTNIIFDFSVSADCRFLSELKGNRLFLGIETTNHMKTRVFHDIDSFCNLSPH